MEALSSIARSWTPQWSAVRGGVMMLFSTWVKSPEVATASLANNQGGRVVTAGCPDIHAEAADGQEGNQTQTGNQLRSKQD